jgi:hypothetical protein
MDRSEDRGDASGDKLVEHIAGAGIRPARRPIGRRSSVSLGWPITLPPGARVHRGQPADPVSWADNGGQGGP